MEASKNRVFVTLKRNILDPQGTAIKRELHSLGYKGIQDVRMGKLIEVSFDAGVDENRKRAMLQEISEKLFANPVIEDFVIE